jgi:3-isopropylmalate/(R)-2-methylmalate dehydratase small subunit
MKKFTKITSNAVYLPMSNVDTDMIIPKQFLKTIVRTGLGKSLFYELRFDESGNERNDFILNQSSAKESKILISGNNFGCGSSREHAVWALTDFGFECVIAPSFADIFYNNCFQNGLLPIQLAKDQIEIILKDIESELTISVDLQNQVIIRGNKDKINFDIDAFKKECLLKGLDNIGLTLKKNSQIAEFESNQKKQSFWLYKKIK